MLQLQLKDEDLLEAPDDSAFLAACQALGILAGHIAEDTHINHSEGSKFTLTPRRIPVERWTIAEKSGADVVMNDGEEWIRC